MRLNLELSVEVEKGPLVRGGEKELWHGRRYRGAMKGEGKTRQGTYLDRNGRVKHYVHVNNTKAAWKNHKEVDFMSFLKYMCIYFVGITLYGGGNALPKSYRLSFFKKLPSMG